MRQTEPGQLLQEFTLITTTVLFNYTMDKSVNIVIYDYDYDYDYEMLLLRHKEIQYNMS